MSSVHGLLRSSALLSLALLALYCTGCARTADVSGTITHNGKPVVCGTVNIFCANGEQRNGEINPNGTYYVAGVPLGPVQAAVYSLSPEHAYKMVLNMQPDPAAAATVRPPDPELVKKWFPISESYRDPQTSGLEFEVRRGPNYYDLICDRPPEPASTILNPNPGGPIGGIGPLQKAFDD